MTIWTGNQEMAGTIKEFNKDTGKAEIRILQLIVLTHIGKHATVMKGRVLPSLGTPYYICYLAASTCSSA
ncbi:MAG: hypothetical protein LRY73_06160 [Bacillus sp. (in: Bacteria)]|nr:hypothetical protein [Bacillus sp. (in: firmicutes)]